MYNPASMSQPSHIVVVDDDHEIRTLLAEYLEKNGLRVSVARDGKEMRRVLSRGRVDLIVLDVMLPGQDGFGVLKALRSRKLAVPVLMLTARDSVADKVAGLDLGADDYLTKPFAFEEFLARVRALLRRRDTDRAPVLRLGDLTVDPATRRVARGERRIELTARQYALLEYFLRNAGRVLTRQMIAQHVWGLDFDAESNVIDVYVGYLRRKIALDHERPLLHTVRGAGYVLQAEE
jgi:DNA-binding response OmpR family regulator